MASARSCAGPLNLGGPWAALRAGPRVAGSGYGRAQVHVSLPHSAIPGRFAMATSNRALVTVSLCAALAACVSTSQVLEVGRDTYSVSATADGYRTAASARDSAFSLGAEKCAM